MIVEIVEGSCGVEEVRHKDTREIIALKQEAYFHIPGSAFPERGKIRVQSPFKPGKYQLKPAYRIGRFGDLELNPFADADLVPASPEMVKKAG